MLFCLLCRAAACILLIDVMINFPDGFSGQYFFKLNLFAFVLLYVTWCTKLQFHGHHSYFRKYFQMLLAANIGHIVH